MMQTGMEPAGLAVLAGAVGLTMTVAGKAIDLGLAAFRKRGESGPGDSGSRPGGFRSEDHLLLMQAREAAVAADVRVQQLATAINGRLTAILDQDRQQTVVLQEMANEFRELRNEMTRDVWRRRDG